MPVVVAVEEMRLLGHDEADDDRVHAHLRRELDAPSSASRSSRPAFAAPYADGARRRPHAAHARDVDDRCRRRPAPASPRSPAARTRCGAVRFSAMIPAVKRGDAVAVSAGGEPPGVVHEHVERGRSARAVARSPRRPARVRACRPRRTATPSGRSSGSWRQQIAIVRARLREALRDAAPDAAAPARDDHGLPVEARLVDRPGILALTGAESRTMLHAPSRSTCPSELRTSAPFPTNA